MPSMTDRSFSSLVLYENQILYPGLSLLGQDWRLCAAARAYILFETAGGLNESHKSIAVGCGRGADPVRCPSWRITLLQRSSDVEKP